MRLELPSNALYPESFPTADRWQERGVVKCNLCGRYGVGRTFVHLLPYGFAAGRWITHACEQCRFSADPIV